MRREWPFHIVAVEVSRRPSGTSRRERCCALAGVCCEPHVDHWHIQDMFRVGANGPEQISSKFPTDEIFACG
jgi:hypothetical protein